MSNILRVVTIAAVEGGYMQFSAFLECLLLLTPATTYIITFKLFKFFYAATITYISSSLFTNSMVKK